MKMENRNSNRIPIFKWTRIVGAVCPPRPRHGHRAVAIRNLMVVFGGGNEGIFDGPDVFDTETNRWHIPTMKGEKAPGRAAFGFVVDNTRIICFGGMVEFGEYSNELYELQASRWEWKQLQPRNYPHQQIPCPRLGHSFNLIGNKAFMFGGLTPGIAEGQPKYLNDLFVLDLRDNGTVAWEQPCIYGISPPPRESHSAITYRDRLGRDKLIIYGGMNGNRLGDLWTLHLETMQWTKEIVCGNVPLPRSLHSATVMSNRMFVFGGWVPLISDDKSHDNFFANEREWKCSNELACLNLDTMVWEELQLETAVENLPRARAGHCALAIESRIYIWSGRDGYRKAWNNQVCCKDLWYLEVEKPTTVSRIQLISSSIDYLEVNWPKIPYVTQYILQIQQYKHHQIFERGFADFTHLPPLCSQPRFSPNPPTSFALLPLPYPSKTSLAQAPSLNPLKTPFMPPFVEGDFPNTCVNNPLSTLYPINTNPIPCFSVTQSYSQSLHTSVPQQSNSSQLSLYPMTSNVNLQNSSKYANQQPQSPAMPTATSASATTAPTPIVITIPPAFPDQLSLSNPPSKTIQSTMFYCNKTGGNTISKPVCITTSATKTISSHIPVACAPRPPISNHQLTPVSAPVTTKASDTRANLLPLLSSRLHSYSATAPPSSVQQTRSPANIQQPCSLRPTVTSSDEATVTSITSVVSQSLLTPSVGQPSTKFNSRPVTVIAASQLAKTLSAGKPLKFNIQKIPSSQAKHSCVIVQKGQGNVIVAKENIPKLTLNQGGQQKTVFKVVNMSQGQQSRPVLSLGGAKRSTIVLTKPSGSTTTATAVPPGTRLITIKRPIIKMPNIIRAAPTRMVEDKVISATSHVEAVPQPEPTVPVNDRLAGEQIPIATVNDCTPEIIPSVLQLTEQGNSPCEERDGMIQNDETSAPPEKSIIKRPAEEDLKKNDYDASTQGKVPKLS